MGRREKENRLFLCLIIGIFLGTVAVNLWNSGEYGLAGLTGRFLEYRQHLAAESGQVRFFQVFRQRCLEIGMLWLLSQPAVSGTWFSLAAMGFGIYIGAAVSAVTCAMGFLGLPCFLFLTLPHTLFYLPGWCAMAERACVSEGRFRKKAVVWLSACFFAGIMLETWINPWLVRVLFSMKS